MSERWKKVEMTCNDLIIWGASDQCRVNYQILKSLGCHIIAVIDDTPNMPSPFQQVPIYTGVEGLDSILGKLRAKNVGFVIAIGNPYGDVRIKLHSLMRDKDLIPVSFADPTSLICATSSYGEGLQVMPSVIVQNDVKIGRQCILNTRSLVEHDCILKDGVEIGPGAVLCGRVYVGENSWIGAHATVKPRVTIGDNTIIGAGAVVVSDIPSNTVAVGVPARVIRENKHEYV
jgi:sugar O-acyltransferase (sialic acid O-acetyltransferase NeuD family)